MSKIKNVIVKRVGRSCPRCGGSGLTTPTNFPTAPARMRCWTCRGEGRVYS